MRLRFPDRTLDFAQLRQGPTDHLCIARLEVAQFLLQADEFGAPLREESFETVDFTLQIGWCVAGGLEIACW